MHMRAGGEGAHGRTRKQSRVTHLFLIALLVLSSGPAYAEWVEIGHSREGTTIYVDSDTIRRKGDRVKMWELYDHATARVTTYGPVLSSRTQSEYDCAEERSRRLALALFSDHMLTGGLLSSISQETTWDPVAPGTLGQSLWKFACDKK